MSDAIRGYAAQTQGSAFEPFEFDPGPVGTGEVEIEVSNCGICYSDLSMLENEWGITEYPFVGGHEAVGRITSLGSDARGLEEGDIVGVGWNASNCGHCDSCIGGYPIHCADLVGTIVGRHGGFAEKVRCDWQWAVRLPSGLDEAKAGPLFCGGITVFTPLVELGIRPTDHVGVVGIGGLGHLALQFADKWGCEVTAFTSDLSKTAELEKLGADSVVNSRDPDSFRDMAGRFDLIISTANAMLDWQAYMKALGPKGKLHISGAVPGDIPVAALDLISAQRSLTGSATGSPILVRKMLEFCARHDIEAVTETFPMSEINKAFAHLKSGSARYRIVLESDF